jgi:hypothetical protein
MRVNAPSAVAPEVEIENSACAPAGADETISTAATAPAIAKAARNVRGRRLVVLCRISGSSRRVVLFAFKSAAFYGTTFAFGSE